MFVIHFIYTYNSIMLRATNKTTQLSFLHGSLRFKKFMSDNENFHKFYLGHCAVSGF